MAKYGINLKYNPFEGKQIDDTMKIDKMIRVNANSIDKQKFLKLGDMYMKLFYIPMKDAHNAIADCEATIKCYFELKKQADQFIKLNVNQKVDKKKILNVVKKKSKHIYDIIQIDTTDKATEINIEDRENILDF